ncbi:MAG: DUF4007 family protein [Spirochaetia bacterium]|nr:DUF4007 family protein [Spirochaetia bacterium]
MTLYFAKHETFQPRHGWFKKCFDAIICKPNFFQTADAHVKLGVGKNMLKAIYFWGQAFKIVNKKDSASNLYATKLGRFLFSENGLDKYLEDTATLWLLHYFLLKKPTIATAWHFAFHEFFYREFSGDDLLIGLSNYAAKIQNKTAVSSLIKDVNCILRMYTENIKYYRNLEDILLSPFNELQLIKKIGNSNKYIFNTNYKRHLPPEIITAVCLDYVSSQETRTNTISLPKLTHEKGSPGMAFKINEKIIEEAIEETSAKHKAVKMASSAGIAHLAYEGEPSLIFNDLLRAYYNKKPAVV